MEHTMSRIIIETTVRKALKDIRENAGRGIRNLVDMALHFSNARFQHEFFSDAQNLLKNENSAYYLLAQDIATHVDEERIVTFGINVGYHGCTLGARIIRKKESELGFNIPWVIPMQMTAESVAAHTEDYKRVIAEGNDLGIYSWFLFLKECAVDVIPLMEAYPDNAFVLFCQPEDATPQFIDALQSVKHVMLAIRDTEGVDEICSILRSKEMLYSVYHIYTPNDVEQIESGEFLCDMEQLHPAFAAFLPDSSCDIATAECVAKLVSALREAQKHQAIAFDLYGDIRTIDSVISENACSIAFDSNGYAIVTDNTVNYTGNLFDSPLVDILRSYNARL